MKVYVLKTRGIPSQRQSTPCPEGQQRKARMATNLYVGNLSYSVTQEQLADLFAQHGNVVSAKVIIDQYTGSSKGFGFVQMETAEAGESAIRALNGMKMANRELRVNVALEKDNRDRPNRGGDRKYNY